MRGVQEDLKRMRREVGKIVDRELFECRDEMLGGVLNIGGVGVGLKLVLSREDIHEDGKHPGNWFENNHEENESDINGSRGNTEGGVELGSECG